MITSFMIVKLLGSLGLFIFGMKQMSEGLQKTAGKRLRRFLAVLTNNAVMGVLVGTGVTSIIQSSSATTVMVVGFVNAGLMTLLQSIGVIMGANIGTTVTAQIVSFELGNFAFHAIAIGGFTYLFAKKKKFQYLGQVLLGFGILFLGLNSMSEAMYPLRDAEYFLNLIENFSRYPILGVLTGFLVTSVVQSSSATFGILVGLVSAGILDFPSGIPVLLGSNIGTTVTALFSSIGANLSAKRAAAAHFIFNVLGSGIIIIIMYLVPNFALKIESALKYLGGLVGFGTNMDAKRLLANTHSLFNITNTLIWLPFVGFMARIVKKVVPGEDTSIERGLVHIDERMLETPSVALEQMKKELVRMHEISSEMFAESKLAFIDGDMEKVRAIEHKEDIVNEIEEELLHFLTKIPQNSLSEDDIKMLDMFFALIDDIESIADDANSIAALSSYKDENQVQFSGHALKELNELFDYVEELMVCSIDLIKTDNIEKYSTRILEGEEKIDQLQLQYRNEHMKRLNDGTCIPNAGIIFLEALEDLEHISDQFADIAQSYLEKDIE